MTVLRKNIRTFNLHADSSELHNLYFEVCTCFLILPKEQSDSTITLYLLLIHDYEKTKRKRNSGGLVFHFPSVIIFNVSNRVKQESNMSEKGYDRVSW